MHTAPDDYIFGACWYTTGNGFLAWPDRLLQAALGLNPLYCYSVVDGRLKARDVSNVYPAGEIYDVCILFSAMLTRAVGALTADTVDRDAIAPIFPQVYLHGSRRTVSAKDWLRGLTSRKVRRENADIRCFQRHAQRLSRLYGALSCSTSTQYLLVGFLALLRDMTAGNLTPAADDTQLVRSLKAKLATAHPLLVRRLREQVESALNL